MSKKLEKVLEHLINEDKDAASAVLHDVIVEKARNVYQELVNEDDMDMDMEDDMDMEEVDEDIGGDQKEDFEDEIAADLAGEDDLEPGDVADLDPDEEMDSEDEEMDSEDEEIEDRVEDIESALADLRSEFDALMQDEMEEPQHDDLADDMGYEDDEMEEEAYYENLDEATKLQDEVAKPDGIEKADDVKSPYSQEIKKSDSKGEPVDFVSSEEKTQKEGEGKDHTPTSNIDVDHEKAPEGSDESEKHADDTDALFTKEVK